MLNYTIEEVEGKPSNMDTNALMEMIMALETDMDRFDKQLRELYEELEKRTKVEVVE